MRKRLFRAISTGLLIVLALAAGCMPIPAQPSGAGSSSTTAAEPPATTSVTATTAATPTTAFTATLPVTATLPIAGTAAATATTPGTATVAATATTPLGPTPEVSTSLPPGATAPGPATTNAGPPGEQLPITLEDNGKTITLKPGDRFLLDLGEGYDWEVTIADQTVVSRVIGVLTIRGSQGLFEARQAGTTTLIANGNPTCLTAQPPCKLPSRTFEVQIDVNAAS